MQIKELLKALEEDNYEMKVVISNKSEQKILDITKAELNYKKDDFKLALIQKY